MESEQKRKKTARIRRIKRIRKKIKGAIRLSVFRSNKHLYAQLIDDEKGETICSVTTRGKSKKSKAAAEKLGNELAQLAGEKKIEQVVFDRGRFKYHGIIAEFAKGAREKGLKF